ncbi:MAG: hypothetical protein HY323_09285 [Betaproteobacteria bacterium]|nr:hypothetical protein [Betaproteobacteria bacterium]
MGTNLLTSPATLPRNLAVVKRRLKKKGLSAWTVAQRAGVSEAMVWMVLAGRRKSARVMAVIEQMLQRTPVA